MATFPYSPDWGCKPTMTPRVNKCQFGDGYDQRAGDGLNTRLPVWPLTFSVRSQTEALAIASWLATNNADVTPFEWAGVNGGVATSEWFGTGNGTQTGFQLLHGGSPVTSIVGTPSIYRTDWQGMQQLYATARTNLLLWSGDQTNAAWIASNVTVVGGQADPDGGTSAATVTATVANGYIYQNATVPNLVHTNSVWIRRKSGTGVVNLFTPGQTPTPCALTSSWQRFQVSSLPISGSTLQLGVMFAVAGDSVDVAFAQAEMGNAATGYIPTTTAPVTVTDYTLSGTGLVTLASAPVSGATLTWSGNYTRKYIADEWTPATADDWGSWSVTAKFRQVPA